MTDQHAQLGDLTHYIGATLDPASWAAVQAESKRRYGHAWQWATYQTERGIHITRLTVTPMEATSAQIGASPGSILHFAQGESTVTNDSRWADCPKEFTEMAKTNDIYASPWLRAEDLMGKTARAKIAMATIENLPQQDGSKQAKVVLQFVGKSKKLILNKTQHTTLCQITGSDDTDDWRGVDVFLSPGVSNTGKGTINLVGVPVAEGEDEEPPF